MDSVFHEIYEKYHQDVYQFIFYMVKDRELAEDLVQEVYIRVLKSYDKFQGKSSIKTWMFSIARNVTIDHYRKQRKERLKNFITLAKEENLDILRDERPIPEEIVLHNDMVRLLYKCLDHCTIDQRTVLIARFIQELSIQETAEILGWSESKVKTTQHRALKTLKKSMKKMEGKEGYSIEEKSTII